MTAGLREAGYRVELRVVAASVRVEPERVSHRSQERDLER